MQKQKKDGQFSPEYPGQFEPGTSGHFKPESGGQFERNLHIRFAKRLHNELTARHVVCFFWMKDAPPGEPLEDIMTSNIKINDKILFVASEASIKSQACQFELSQGRKKQEETWEHILFPIHIDNYLFEVEKNKIRPLDKADEYWKNIMELRAVNSADFKTFNKERIDNKKFKEAVGKIVSQLALKP